MKPVLALTFALVAITACKKEAAPPTTPTEPAATDRAACTTDADCVAVELACCDACNGGEAVAVNKAHAEEAAAESAQHKGACTDVACTEMACAPWAPTCTAGTCTLARGAMQ